MMEPHEEITFRQNDWEGLSEEMRLELGSEG